jgi:hypothetical protein
MALMLSCPCGARIIDFDDTFVASVQEHLAAEHPDRHYSEDDILAFAMSVGDKNVKK